MTKTITARKTTSKTNHGTSALDRETTSMMRDMATVLMLTKRVAHEIYADVPARQLRPVSETVCVG